MTNILYVQTDRDQEGFYSLMGPFFGNRAAAKELGMPIWNDPDRQWIVAIDSAASRPIACASIEFLKTKGKAVLKSAWVEPAFRHNGVYARLCLERFRIAQEHGVHTLTATVTDKSLDTLLEHGFVRIGMRGKYMNLRLEMNPIHGY
ncbi:GNAT family N-acetyltransferase [Paenibacillus sp. NRS-1783]|uniref:GNAT family N-acetyltransferase n=1 Tax=Paenibacillus sp. NRS-1783 TaxID=3233907 RepID=UPI003D2C7B85